MGIVAKQSVLNTIYTYVGFLFGALNTLFLFTYIFSKTNYGLITYLMTAGNLLWPFIALGMHNTIIKFFHEYQSQRDKNRFFSWMLVIPFITTFFLGFIYYNFRDFILAYFQNSNEVVAPYISIILILAFCTAYFELFFAWTRIHLKSVLGNFLKTVFIRFCISILLLLVYLNAIAIVEFIYALTICYAIRTLLMGIVAYNTNVFYFDLKCISNTKAVFTYASLILMASVVGSYLLDLDKVMIEYFLPIEKLPAYSIAIYIASVIAVPARALNQITAPLTANFLNNNDMDALQDLNKKSSLNGLLITGFIAVLILSNTHAIFSLVPKNYNLYFEIVFCIALVRVFDASLGTTNSILVNSDKYKWVLFFGLAVLVLAFFLNTILIPKYGIIGAAIATFVSYFVFNIVKLLYVKHYLNIQPYQFKSIGILLLFLGIGVGFYHLNFESLSLISNILIKGISSSIILGISIYKLRFSNEINQYIISLRKK